MTAVRFPTLAGARGRIPLWLRPRPGATVTRVRITPRESRWWVAAIVLVVSILLLSFVGHIALFGALQQSRAQSALYDELRIALANGTAPLGPTDVHDRVVPAGTPIATIIAPTVGLRQVIVQGSGPDQLRLGPGHRRDTVFPGQVGTSVVLGRQTAYGGPFRSLGRLQPGDPIVVTTGQGRSVFAVMDVRTPGDRLPIAAKSTESRIQLVTAAGPELAPDSVLYVDAVRSAPGRDAASPIIATPALDPGENAMQTDPDALLPFLFALQWLVLASGLSVWLFRVWGRWQTWIIALPVLVALGAVTSDAAIGFFPNLL